MKTAAEYCLGDMTIRYRIDEEFHVGLELYPTDMKSMIKEEKKYNLMPIVQWKREEDAFPFGFSNGMTMIGSESVYRMKWKEQYVEKEENVQRICTVLEGADGSQILHCVSYKDGDKSLKVETEFRNYSKAEIVLEMLSSFSIGGMTPFSADEGTDCLILHKIRSKWSAEGRVESRSAEELLLEPSWSRHGVYSEKYGQTGSLPVRGYFPFGAVEDKVAGVVWAAALACPSTWQMEFYRRDESLCMAGGIGDYDFGHWRKMLKTGEVFRTVPAYVTVHQGNLDDTAQRLSTMWKKNRKIDCENHLPIIFNEFCTTWGMPSHENISGILRVLKEHPVDYFVIDAGWYADPVKGWESNMGDWEVSKELFPKGLETVVEEIKECGFIPGIWFEVETCGKAADAYKMEEHLLKRHGNMITSGGRRFWDMRDTWVQEYLTEKVIFFLEKYQFGFLKVDYNESIGIGCDGAESLGEGLRQNMEASAAFYRKLKTHLPDLKLEICASGGHRMEPSMLDLCDLVSFSDAHEEKEIPVIASNIQRLVPPELSEIWAVLRKTDSEKRLVYSMVSTYFGIMCLSGDIFELSKEQWDIVDKGMEFYRKIRHIIKDGQSCFFGNVAGSWRKLRGWQGNVRYSDEGEALCLIHQFAENDEKVIRIPVEADYQIEGILEDKKHEMKLENNVLEICMQDEFEAMAVYLKRK